MRVDELVRRDVTPLRRDEPVDALVEALERGAQDVFPVLDERGRVVGSVSEQDLVRVVAPSRRTFPFGPRKLVREGLVRDVGDVMTPRPSTARPDEPIEPAVKRMADLGLSQLVVVDEHGGLVGLLRGRDVFLAMRRGERGGP